jgi:hypothetical protein
MAISLRPPTLLKVHIIGKLGTVKGIVVCPSGRKFLIWLNVQEPLFTCERDIVPVMQHFEFSSLQMFSSSGDLPLEDAGALQSTPTVQNKPDSSNPVFYVYWSLKPHDRDERLSHSANPWN